MDGLFDSITGLPVHPLAVHAAVALLPLSALSLVAAVFWPWWGRRLGAVSLGLLTIAVPATFLAKESGEALAGHLGTPVEHAEWADRLFAVAVLTWLAAATWWFLTRRRTAAASGQVTSGDRVAPGGTRATGSSATPALRRSGTWPRVLGLVTAALAVATTVLTVVVGHSGADATWRGALDGTGTGQETRAFSMEQVARHADPASCWTVIDGTVYDLTPWFAAHPADQPALVPACGKDGGVTVSPRLPDAATTLAPSRLGTISAGEGEEG